MGADEMSPNSYLSEFIQILSRDVVTSEAQQLSDPNIWRQLLAMLKRTQRWKTAPNTWRTTATLFFFAFLPFNAVLMVVHVPIVLHVVTVFEALPFTAEGYQQHRRCDQQRQ